MTNHSTNGLTDGSNLVFLVGCPRSGTTWVQRLLAAHERVQTGQESNLFRDYIAPPLHAFLGGLQAGRGGIGLACYFTETEFEARLRDYLASLLTPMLENLPPDGLFLEKTPDHALFLSEIARFLPKARVIHLLRDPRDVVASLLAASQSWGADWAPNDAGKAAQIWLKNVQAARAGSHLFAPDRFLEVRYEELLANPDANLRVCAEFLGLEWSQSDLEAAISQNRADSDQKATKIELRGEAAKAGGEVQEPQGFVRRARAGSWRQDLSPRDQFRVWRLIFPQMQEFGYDWAAQETRRFTWMQRARRVVRR